MITFLVWVLVCLIMGFPFKSVSQDTTAIVLAICVASDLHIIFKHNKERGGAE